MKNSVSGVLLRWADSRWAWFPWHRRVPPREQVMGWGLVVAGTVLGFLAWAALAVAVLWWLGWPMNAAGLGVAGFFGASLSFVWAAMMRLAWNRRVADHGGAPVPVAGPLHLAQQLLVKPLLLLLILGIALALTRSLENFRGALAYRAFRAESEAKGENLRLTELLPPTPAENENLAYAPIYRGLLDYRYVVDPVNPKRRLAQFADTNAITKARRLGVESLGPRDSFRGFAASRKRPESSWQDGDRLDLPMWKDYLLSGTNAASNLTDLVPARAVLGALAKVDPEWNVLRAEAAARPKALFPVHWEEGFDALLPHLSVMKEHTALLRLRAVALLAEGRGGEALADVTLGYRLSDALRDEPLLISVLVRIAMDNLLLQPVWEACLERRWSDAQLAELAALLETRDFVADLTRALRGERASANRVYDYLVNGGAPGTSDPMELILPEPLDSGPLSLMRFLPWGWFRQNQVVHGRYLQLLVDRSQRSRWHVDGVTSDHEVLKFALRRSPYTMIAAMMVPALDKASDRAFEAQVRCDLARVGLALERYRLGTGSYPATLDLLAPRYLPRVPEDRMDGKPLRYSKSEDGDYHLYSVGRNHRDNGGTRGSRKARSKGEEASPDDYVWRLEAGCGM